MPVRFTMNLPRAQRAIRAGADAFLGAAAEAYRSAVLTRYGHHGGGYTTGDHVNADDSTVQSIRASEPYANDAGGRAIAVFTDKVTAVYWTLGFQHAGANGQYHRVDHWTPAMLDSAAEQMSRGAAAARAAFNASAS
jgi:hypothetical protein